MAAVVVVIGGTVSSVVWSRRKVDATAQPGLSSTIPLETWADSLGLVYQPPSAGFPNGALRGHVSGYELQVFESAMTDSDGGRGKPFVTVLVFGQRRHPWPTVLRRAEATRLATTRPALAAVITALTDSGELTVAVGRVMCALDVVDEAGKTLAIAVLEGVVSRAIELARHLDDNA